MICHHGHRVIISSIPDPAGELHWTVVEVEPGVYRYAIGRCDEIPDPTLPAAPAQREVA